MIDGTIALLERTVDEPLESFSSGGFATLDVRETQQYLDGSQVQHGAVCDTVEGETEEIIVNGSEIDIDQVPTRERCYAEWYADVTDAGFVAATRTAGTDPPFPFGVFRARTGVRVEPARIDVPGFASEQDPDPWFVGSEDEARDDVRMDYHASASLDVTEPNIGLGFHTDWQGTIAKGVLYSSGYIAIHESNWGPIQFARFLVEEVLPHAYVPDEDEEEQQSTLEGVA